MNRRILLICLVVNLLLYAGLVALYPLDAGLLKPRLSWGQQAAGAPAAGLAHAAIYLVLFGVYAAVAWRMVRAQPATLHRLLPLILIGWLACSLLLLASFPGESADVFDYLFRGRMMTEYHLSPLNTAPAIISNKPFHRYLAWSDWVDAYGPLWEYASAAVSWLVARMASPAELRVVINQTCAVQPALCSLLVKYVTAYRVLAMALAGLCGVLIFAIVQQRTANKAVATLALLLWLWNPLVIISTAVGAHNDVLMLVFILLAVWCAQHRRWLPALLLIFVAAHVKITACVALPALFLWMAHREGARRAIFTLLASIAIMLPVSFALYFPLGGWATLPRNLYERSLISVNSLGELAYRYLRESQGMARPAAQQLASRASLAAFVLACALMLLMAWRKRATQKSSADPSNFWLLVLVLTAWVYLALGSFWFQSWYVLLVVALVALLPASKLTRCMIAACAGALLAALASDYLRAGGFVPAAIVSIITVALILAPAVLAWFAPRRTMRPTSIP